MASDTKKPECFLEVRSLDANISACCGCGKTIQPTKLHIDNIDACCGRTSQLCSDCIGIAFMRLMIAQHARDVIRATLADMVTDERVIVRPKSVEPVEVPEVRGTCRAPQSPGNLSSAAKSGEPVEGSEVRPPGEGRGSLARAAG